MKQMYIAGGYAIIMFGIFIIDTIVTKRYGTGLANLGGAITRQKSIFYLLINTNLLILLDIYFFSSFFLEKKVYALVQNRIIKVFSVVTWVIISLLENWYYQVYIYFSLQLISFLYLDVAYRYREDVNIRRYNVIVGADLTAVNKILIKESLVAFKIIFAVFLYTYFIELLVFSRRTFVLLQTSFKLFIYWIDITLRLNGATEIEYYGVTSFLYLCATGTGIIGLCEYAYRKQFILAILYFINEILLEIVTLCSIVCFVLAYRSRL